MYSLIHSLSVQHPRLSFSWLATIAQTGLTGVALVQYNLAQELGSWAPTAIAVFIVMFSFSSLIGNYYYGEINISHLTDKKYCLHLFRIGVVLMTFIGSIASLDLVWNLADLFMAFLVLTNISSIVRMGRTAGLALDDYIKQRKAGIDTPVFNRSVLNHTFGIVWWGEGQTTDSSVPATPVEDTIENNIYPFLGSLFFGIRAYFL